MNRKERRAARKQGRSTAARSDSTKSNGSSHLFALALSQHQAGQLAAAERVCRKVLASDPNHADSLHLLGVIARQVGRNDTALDLIGKAIALRPEIPNFHYNIGSTLHAMGRLKEAVAHYQRVIVLQPNWAEAHLMLGNALFELGALAEAAVEYERALGVKPDYAQALYMLANTLQLRDRLEDAVVRYQQALALQPNFAEVHNNLGNAFRQQGRLDDAVAQCRRSLALKWDNPEAHNNLALALQQQGLLAEAIGHYHQALALRPDFLEAHQNCCSALIAQGSTEQALTHALRALEIRGSPEAKALFVQCVRDIANPATIAEIGKLRRHVIQALSAPWGRPSELAHFSAALVKMDSAIRDSIERMNSSPQHASGQLELTGICKNEMLRCLLQSTPVSDLELERLLTAARMAMLDLATTATPATRVEKDVLSFCCSLARQCFINEYVFGYTDSELDHALQLRSSLVSALQSGGPVRELWLVAVAAYFPLHSLPAVESIQDRSWSGGVMSVVNQQVLEPRQERAYRATIPRVTAINDQTSVLVQRQYEENPYPRWVKTAPMGKPATVGKFLRGLFPMASSRRFEQGKEIQILLAGCGTGQQAIETAQRFPGAGILAIDLSLASLSYAVRKTRELGLHNIQYAQGDILHLQSIGRTFDVIEAMGVLHHLADPIAGWRVLVSLLRPGGFMRLGIYSELARQDVIAAQDYVAQRGYTSSDADIRRCRQDLARLADDIRFKSVTRVADFYSTSGCRDLLFHVQEHRMNLPEIDRFLGENDLKFLGFHIGSRILTQFRQRFPWTDATTDLKLWHAFETENPMTFIRMYQFWVQKE
jgi:tetratricopeptide (TPR) repeat protein/2-polyprenyl-3-methyl-5-hydroxy-6-metoxy-1,4-benzoquinol methylase